MTVPSRQLARSARRNADQAKQALADLPRPHFLATVTNLVPGAARDGLATVYVTYRGVEILANGYESTYTPAIGHWVTVVVIDNQFFVRPNIVGAP